MRISGWSSDVCASDLDRAVLDQVDQPLEAALDTDREIQHRRTRAQAILDHADAHLEIRTRAIELVDEAHARDVLFFGLAPHRLGLLLAPGDADRTISRLNSRP